MKSCAETFFEVGTVGRSVQLEHDGLLPTWPGDTPTMEEELLFNICSDQESPG